MYSILALMLVALFAPTRAGDAGLIHGCDRLQGLVCAVLSTIQIPWLALLVLP